MKKILLATLIVSLGGCAATAPQITTFNTTDNLEIVIEKRGCLITGGTLKNNSGVMTGQKWVHVMGIAPGGITVGDALVYCEPSISGGISRCSSRGRFNLTTGFGCPDLELRLY
jgi:hypothetical protein